MIAISYADWLRRNPLLNQQYDKEHTEGVDSKEFQEIDVHNSCFYYVCSLAKFYNFELGLSTFEFSKFKFRA